VITAKNEQPGAKLPQFMMQQASGRLLHMDQHQALAVWDHLVLVIWRGEVDVAAVQRLERAGLETLRRHPRGIALMGVIESTAVPPSAEMRKLSAASNDRMAKQGLVGIAGILSQQGFAGSVMRGVITGLTLISRAEHPFKVFENHTDGAIWLAKQLSQRGEHMGAVECGGVVGSYRSQYEQFYKRNLTPQ
jgi:hypothetical protein